LDSEQREVAAVRGQLIEPGELEERLGALDAATAKGSFDQVRSALEEYASLFERFYGDRAHRAALESKIDAAARKLPPQIRIEVGAELVDAALAHGDADEARRLIEKLEALREGSRWTAEQEIPLLAQSAILRHRVGDDDFARAATAKAGSLFDERHDTIVDIDRADALRAIAEAQQCLGDRLLARATYARALEAGVENPNSRPRAEDLSATCCSMAAQRFEPDAKLWKRIREIRDALGNPW
jgi:hypothetical protein